MDIQLIKKGISEIGWVKRKRETLSKWKGAFSK